MEKPLVSNLCKYSQVDLLFSMRSSFSFLRVSGWKEAIVGEWRHERESVADDVICVWVMNIPIDAHLLCSTQLEFRSLSAWEQSLEWSEINSSLTWVSALVACKWLSFVCTHSLKVKEIHLLNCMNTSKSFCWRNKKKLMYERQSRKCENFHSSFRCCEFCEKWKRGLHVVNGCVDLNSKRICFGMKNEKLSFLISTKSFLQST